jgi:hypothetical protein
MTMASQMMKAATLSAMIHPPCLLVVLSGRVATTIPRTKPTIGIRTGEHSCGPRHAAVRRRQGLLVEDDGNEEFVHALSMWPSRPGSVPPWG